MGCRGGFRFFFKSFYFQARKYCDRLKNEILPNCVWHDKKWPSKLFSGWRPSVRSFVRSCTFVFRQYFWNRTSQRNENRQPPTSGRGVNCYFIIWPNKAKFLFFNNFLEKGLNYFYQFLYKEPVRNSPENLEKLKIFQFYRQRTRFRLISGRGFEIFGSFSDFKPTPNSNFVSNEVPNDALIEGSYTPTERKSELNWRTAIPPISISLALLNDSIKFQCNHLSTMEKGRKIWFFGIFFTYIFREKYFFNFWDDLETSYRFFEIIVWNW